MTRSILTQLYGISTISMAKSNQLVNYISDIALSNLKEFHMKFKRSKVRKFKKDDRKRGIHYIQNR